MSERKKMSQLKKNRSVKRCKLSLSGALYFSQICFDLINSFHEIEAVANCVDVVESVTSQKTYLHDANTNFKDTFYKNDK